jgi:hypothetical protein
LASLSLLPSLGAATALTYKLAPSETQCFYATADKKGSKVAFYFAVGLSGSAFPLNAVSSDLANHMGGKKGSIGGFF